MTAVPKLSGPEAETVYLLSAIDIIDGMVNREMLTVHADANGAASLFSTSTHQRVFNILLVDFLSKSDRRAPVDQQSFLAALRAACAQPHFSVEGSIDKLCQPVSEMTRWLEDAPAIDVWFPSLDREVRLQLPRIAFLKMTGDIAKHDLLRTVGVAEDLSQALASAGVTVDIEDALLALEDFYARFHTDILNYHGTHLVELLNNVRWGIHEYLLPEFRRSFSPEGGDSLLYTYKYPENITGKFARDRYWALMNSVRRGPLIPCFTTAPSLRSRY